MTSPAYLSSIAARTTLTPVSPMGDARSEFLRRASGYDVDPSGALNLGDIHVDTDAYAASVNGTPLDLSPRQVELLAVFVAAPTRVWSREQLHWICWGDMKASRRVDVQLCRIRTKVGFDLFRNIRDRGWTLNAG